MTSQKEYLDKMAEMVVEMEDEEIGDLCREYLKEGYDPEEAIFNGLIKGMNEVGRLFEEEEYFISDLLICSDAMYNGIDVLKEKIESYGENNLATAVIGVVEGDTHDIGKNLVKLMLEVNGFKMIDLGKDVPCEKFVDEAIKNDAQFIMMSTLMTTTMANMKKVIDILNERNIRDQFIVMVGGGPVSESFAKDIGADAYSENANEAVKVAKSLIKNHEN
ncbi:corrinoid protein [Anaerococcus vaginalis]|uniref:B12 binding domain protein n=2 Tax=Anaerococcus vaginalis TaxID=33037 RepID=C7HV52_9FIRM|nr:corrinoid protein [Anaerococcus vaginalis]EEU12364.1 B12 binding domain protein [Anaerococcus vaginalis ATCC 51170]QQB61513.1 corrinoid protein [Anaerococcus vaginalis]